MSKEQEQPRCVYLVIVHHIAVSVELQSPQKIKFEYYEMGDGAAQLKCFFSFSNKYISNDEKNPSVSQETYVSE